MKSLRILVVDDNRDLVATTVLLLRSLGHDAREYYSGVSAYDCFKEYNPDIVLMDIGLPGRSGWDIAREIRERVPGKRPTLIGISGEFTQSDDFDQAKAIGFDFYLKKGDDPKHLVEIIEQ